MSGGIKISKIEVRRILEVKDRRFCLKKLYEWWIGGLLT